MTTSKTYPIGQPMQPWTETEKQTWLNNQSIKRSYLDEVLAKLTPLKANFDLQQYGQLEYQDKSYPLMLAKSLTWSSAKPTILITGGVHGYETSGVHGGIDFLDKYGQNYAQTYNILAAPCISPWGYETINRWNPHTIDPNRSFHPNSPASECAALMDMVAKQGEPILAHFDLHETTDTDESEFRPALAAREGNSFTTQHVPDGFYLVADSSAYDQDFQKAMIEQVQTVTHIAPADAQGKIIDVPIVQPGVILYDVQKLHLCTGFTRAPFSTTTEVYPDSPKTDSQRCILAQTTAVKAGLDYLTDKLPTLS